MDVHADDAAGVEAGLLQLQLQRHLLSGQLRRVHQTATALDPVRLRQLADGVREPAPTGAPERVLLARLHPVPAAAVRHRLPVARLHGRHAHGRTGHAARTAVLRVHAHS